MEMGDSVEKSGSRADRKSALLLVGHGSTENPASSDPTHELARLIRERGIFAEVHCAFWKEEPNLRMAGYAIEASEVYVVPHFVSEGYFTREVIPREMELTGPTTSIHGKIWHSCDPVGVHPRLTELLLERAREIGPDAHPEETALLIVGHGTALSARSTEATRAQVRRLRESGAPYREVREAYLEVEPFVSNWDKLCESPAVIVLPFFVADGLHRERDIPNLLGLDPERRALHQNPFRVRGKCLYLAGAIGSGSAMADIIVDQVRNFDATRGKDQ